MIQSGESGNVNYLLTGLKPEALIDYRSYLPERASCPAIQLIYERNTTCKLPSLDATLNLQTR